LTNQQGLLYVRRRTLGVCPTPAAGRFVEIRESIQIFISLFALVNPLEGIPFLLAKTGGCQPALREEINRRTATAVTVILLASALVGAKVLALFGIGLPAFQVGGGIILFLIAVQMTLLGVAGNEDAPPTTTHHGSPLDIAIVPLAMPLLGGPGAVSGAILYGTRTQSYGELAILCGIALLVGLATYISLRLAEQLRHWLGDTGINIATRLMGLLIAAIAAQLTIEGLIELMPILGQHGTAG
jgi:multiple antibiotic resistance protein